MAYLPMGGVIIAFKDYNYVDGIWGSKWIGLKNFEFLFLSQDAWRITRNTLMMNGLFIFFGTICAILVALAMNEIRVKWVNKAIQSTLFLPYLLSWVIVSYLVFAILTTKGFLNAVLASIGLEPINWYMEPKYWPYILTMITLWKVTGYNSIIYLASIIGINPEFYEAAKLDGANKLQQIRYITMPFLIPVISILTLLAIEFDRVLWGVCCRDGHRHSFEHRFFLSVGLSSFPIGFCVSQSFKLLYLFYDVVQRRSRSFLHFDEPIFIGKGYDMGIDSPRYDQPVLYHSDSHVLLNGSLFVN